MRPRQIPPPQRSDDRLQPAERHAAPERGRDDKIGAPPLFAIRDLGAQDVGKPAFAHSRPAHHPLALQAQRRRHDQHEVAALDAAAFKEQRYVEDNQRRAASAGSRATNRLSARRTIGWMIPSRRRSAGGSRNTRWPQTLPIDPAGLVAHPRKRRFDRLDRRPSRPEQPMDVQRRRRTAARRAAAAPPPRCFFPSRSSR